MHHHEPPSVTVSRCGSTDSTDEPFRTVVWVRGDHDIASQELLSDTFACAARLDGADVVVDISEVTFMDASTISAIVDAHNRLRARSRSLSIRGVAALSRRLLDVCDLAFLIDGHQAPTQTSRAPALSTWVPVPATDRTSDPASRPADEPATEADGAGPQRTAEPAGSVRQRRAPS